MPNAKHDDEVIRAAMHLEFVANTPGPNLDGSSFEEILTDMILYDMGCGKVDDYVLKERRELLDQERRERIKRAWKKLRHAISVSQSHLSEHDDVVELQVVAIKTHDTLSGRDVVKVGLHNPAAHPRRDGHMLILDNDNIFDPIELKPGDVLQVRKK